MTPETDTSRDTADLIELRPCYSITGLRAFIAKHHPDYVLSEAKSTMEPYDSRANTHTIETAGWGPKFALVGVGVHRCGKITDGISLDLCECRMPNGCQWHPGGVISFADLEAIYLAAKKARGLP